MTNFPQNLANPRLCQVSVAHRQRCGAAGKRGSIGGSMHSRLILIPTQRWSEQVYTVLTEELVQPFHTQRLVNRRLAIVFADLAKEFLHLPRRLIRIQHAPPLTSRARP